MNVWDPPDDLAKYIRETMLPIALDVFTHKRLPKYLSIPAQDTDEDVIMAEGLRAAADEIEGLRLNLERERLGRELDFQKLDIALDALKALATTPTPITFLENPTAYKMREIARFAYNKAQRVGASEEAPSGVASAHALQGSNSRDE